MTEPSSHAGFRDIARKALSKRTGIPAKTDWEVFLHGFASTNQLGGEAERDIYECLLRTFPTPEAVLEKDLKTLRDESGCQSLISPVNSADWMKRNAENWDNIRPLLRCRTRADQDAIRNFIEDPKNQNKRLVKEFVGAGYKGSDMTLLWGGCEVPVVDKQLVRYLAPTMLGTDWDSYIRDQLSERKANGRKLRLGSRFAAELGRDVEATDIDVDNPNHRYAEEEAIVGKIQSTVGRYGAWRDLAYQMADAEGVPANVWHVATWLEYRIGGDPDSPRVNSKVLARGKEFADRTYAPSETPSDYNRETTPTIYHGTIFDFTPEEIRSGTRGEGIWLASNRQAAQKITGLGASVLTPEDAKRMDGARVLGYRIKPEARIHTIPYWDGIAYEPLVEAMVKEGADVLEIVRTEDILARGNRASYYLVQNPDILEPVSATEAGPGTEGFHEVSFWNPPSETPEAWFSRRSDRVKKAIADGGGITVRIPYGGDDISEEKFFSMLNYMPDYHNNYTPGQKEFWIHAGPKTDEARQIKNALYDLHTMRADYYIRQLRGEIMDVELRDEIKQAYKDWANQNPLAFFTPDQRAYFIPPSVKDISDLDVVVEDVERLKRDLQDSDMELWRAYMEGEQDAIDRGLQSPSAVTNDQMNYLNAEVNDRISYGLRNETVERGRGPAYILAWSNGSAEWFVYARREKVGSTVRLDANQILGYGKKADLDEAAPLLDPLPLYTGSFEYRQQGKQDPGAFVGFETPFGFDEAIQVMWQDWVQYKIADTPVVVRRIGAKAGTKVNPRYKGARAAQELHIDFQLKASNRKDMQKIDFLLQRLREDNPSMNVRVNVKTNGSTARRNLPSWEERPYRLEPAMFIGYESPDEYDDNIVSYSWEHTDPHPEMEDHALITTKKRWTPSVRYPGGSEDSEDIELLLGLHADNPLGLSENEREIYKATYFTQPDTSRAYYEIDGVDVYIDYGSHTVGQNPVDPAVEMKTINNAAMISIQRRSDSKPTFNTFRMIGKFLDRIVEENPGIRLFADAKGDPIEPRFAEGDDEDDFELYEQRVDEAMERSRGDIRARVYTRFGWEKLYETEGQGEYDVGGWHMEYKPTSPSRVSTAFDGIDGYASDIMELV